MRLHDRKRCHSQPVAHEMSCNKTICFTHLLFVAEPDVMRLHGRTKGSATHILLVKMRFFVRKMGSVTHMLLVMGMRHM
jgi:hypothetical protein